VRGLRGAICLQANEAEEMREAVGELVRVMLDRNGLTAVDIVSVILTATPDLTCAFPAEGARAAGLTDVPLLCAQEMDVTGALPRVIRILMHIEAGNQQLEHVYLRGAEALRQDLHRG
jgi:chorismate mutase